MLGVLLRHCQRSGQGPLAVNLCRMGHLATLRTWPRARGYSSHRGVGGGNERLWAVGAVTLTIPALVWIYQRHQQKPKASSSSTGATANGESHAIVVSDLKDVSTGLGSADLGDGTGGTALAAQANTLSSHDPAIRAKYVLVGGGSASFAAMEEIRRLEPGADVLVIGDETYVPYMRPPLSKELWFSTDDAATAAFRFTDWHGEEKPIFYQDSNYYETGNIRAPNGKKPRLLLGHRAVTLDVEDKIITLDNGQQVSYERLLLATGGRPKQLSVLSEAAPTVATRCSTFRGAADLLTLQEVAQKAGRIAIIGGGFLGSELAVALAQFSRMHRQGALQVTQIFPEDGNMALVFPRYLSRWTMGRMRKAGIRVIPGTNVVGVETRPAGDHEQQSSAIELKLSNGKVVEADHVLIAIGIEPNVELASSAGLELDPERGGLVTNAQLHVCKGVYAAGDLISFHDPSLGVRRRLEHYDHAILTGRLAGSNMVVSANGPSPPALTTRKYGVQSMFWSDLGPEIGYEAVGLVDAKLTTVGVWAEAASEDTPKGADLDPSDIRAQPVGRITSRASAVAVGGDDKDVAFAKARTNGLDRLKSVIASPVGEKTYGKGVVFYVDDGRIVGVLMFNLFNRIELARDIIMKRTRVEELESIVDLFNINEGRNGQNGN